MLLNIAVVPVVPAQASVPYTVNLEILAAKIFSVSRSIDILANINFSDLVLGYFSLNFIVIVMVGSSLLVVLRIS